MSIMYPFILAMHVAMENGVEVGIVTQICAYFVLIADVMIEFLKARKK